MRIKSQIPLSQIVVDRLPINPTTLALIDFLRAGGQVPPVKLAKLLNGKYKLLDGRHRFLAFKMLGRDTIESKFNNAVSKVPLAN